MPRMSDNASLVLMTFIALGTLGGVILTSGARKMYMREMSPEKGSLDAQLRRMGRDD